MRKLIMIAVAAMAMAIAIPAVALADTVSTDFEAFSPGSVNGQDGWKSAVPGDVPALPNGYDQEVIGSGLPAGFNLKALRMSNVYTDGEFHFQTYSKPTTEVASEDAGEHHVFDSSFQFTSASSAYQPGLALSVSPDEGEGGRMSYIGLEDQSDGIHLTFYDTPETNGHFVAHDAGVVTRNQVHTIRFHIKLIAGADNDIVRVSVDGRDIGDCLTTWENFFRTSSADNFQPHDIDRLEFRASGTAAPAGTTGYLFDQVSSETNDSAGPTPGRCGTTGAFCSPGYWKNAPDAAWAKVAPITRSSTFNSVVVPDYYADPIASNPKLSDVLKDKSATKYGKAAAPFGLNPYNAVGAALTSKLPGYTFSGDASIDTCPLDGKGNWKPGAGPTS